MFLSRSLRTLMPTAAVASKRFTLTPRWTQARLAASKVNAATTTEAAPASVGGDDYCDLEVRGNITDAQLTSLRSIAGDRALCVDAACRLSTVERRKLAMALLLHQDARSVPEELDVAGNAFDKLDVNADGLLSKNEFKLWYDEYILSQQEDPNAPVNKKDLGLVFLRGMIPYIGFGICDNALMIICGDIIDQTIGVRFHLSTMAAAGLGNLVSCSTGVFTGGVIDKWASRLGVPVPDLTTVQRESIAVKNSALYGSLCGITLGCLIGMFPLFFMNNERAPAATPSAQTI